MTDRELIKALRCHQKAISTGGCPKDECPMFERPSRQQCPGEMAKAAAHWIEELIKQVADLEARESHWISVETRLPERAQRVLVKDRRSTNRYTREYDSGDDCECWYDEGGWWNPIDAVTDWMPLPEWQEESKHEM